MTVVIWIFRSRNHTERTRCNTVTAAIANIVLDVNVPELVVDYRTRRARLLARRLFAMLAHITHHQPPVFRTVAVASGLFLKCDMTPGGCPDVNGVVVAVTGKRQAVRRKLI